MRIYINRKIFIKKLNVSSALQNTWMSDKQSLII